MSFIQEFINRGYLYQCTSIEDIKNLSDNKKIVVYVGMDCTAKSLHVGNLLQLMVLRLLQQYGHKPIFLIGGVTTKIGDPTGKDSMRKMLTDEEISDNIDGIKKSLSKFITFGDADSDAIILNNSTWLNDLGYIEFLNTYGRCISINHMMTLDSVKTRLERMQPLTFLEFNYALLQAYDFYYLKKNYNCVLQIGGSDQWGNIIMGVELCRKLGLTDVYGLTTPLMTTASGAKMGKSANGAVWLNEEMLSVYDYYQYWRNSDDSDVVRFAKLYAEFSQDKLEDFINLAKSNINEAKKELALKITILCHGELKAKEAHDTSITIFEKGGVDINMPSFEITKDLLESGVMLYDILFNSQLVSSKSEGRRLIKGGGIKINDQKVENENLLLESDMFNNGTLKVSAGKKKHLLIILK